MLSAKKLNKEVAIVKWNDLSALEVYNLYRALFGLYELKTTWQGIPIKLLCLTLRDFNDNGMESIKLKSLPPGSVRYSGEHQVLLVTCRDKPIGVCTLAVKGKLYCAKNFYRGFITQSRTAATKFGD